MASTNNSKTISDAHPHTIKKFELIETYIKSWVQKLMLTESYKGIIFIDCMCNSGVYKNDDGENVYGTPIRVAKALLIKLFLEEPIIAKMLVRIEDIKRLIMKRQMK